MVNKTIARNEITGKFGEYEERPIAGSTTTKSCIEPVVLESVFYATVISFAKRKLMQSSSPENSHV